MNKKNLNYYWTGVILNALFLAAAIFFCEPKYEVSDDFLMETILAGSYGTGTNPHMLFVNILYGNLLQPLYHIFPKTNWYTISLLSFGFLACIGLTLILVHSLDGIRALFFNLLFLIFFSNDLFILLQFTKTASICCFVGGLLILYSLFHKNSERKLIQQPIFFLYGIILCFIGSLIRIYAVYLVAPFIIVTALCEGISNLRSKSNDYGNYVLLIKRIALCCVIVLAIFFGHLIDQKSYNKNSEYQYYLQYATVRGAIVDRQDYGYPEYADDLKEIGISENDYYMLCTWNFVDPDYFPLEKLKKISNIFEEHNRQQWQGFQSIYNDILQRKYTSYPVCIACIILFLICMLWNTANWKWYLLACLPTGALILYFFIRGRVVYRVEFGIFLCTFLSLLYFYLQTPPPMTKENHKLLAAGIITGVCMLLHLPTYFPDSDYKLDQVDSHKSYVDSVFDASWNYNPQKYRTIVNKTDLTDGLIDEINQHQNNTYLLDFNTTIQSLYYDWSVFESLGIGYYKNFCYLSGVAMNFPDVNHSLQNMGIENPIKDLVKENVYLVDNINSKIILNYLKEHYYPDAKIKWVKNVEGYDIWKLSIK